MCKSPANYGYIKYVGAGLTKPPSIILIEIWTFKGTHDVRMQCTYYSIYALKNTRNFWRFNYEVNSYTCNSP